MHDLAKTYRAAQLFAHNAHNTIKGQTFFQDHEFFATTYGSFEEAYDAIIERMIGLGFVFDIAALTKEAGTLASTYPVQKMNAKDLFESLLGFETIICTLIMAYMESKSTNGTQDLLQGLADDSEMRQYKIKQRLMV
jgi:DNA-binding ferritin-like protein